MNLHVFSILCFTFGTLLVAVLACAKRRDAIALRFLIFCLAVSGWGFLASFWMSNHYHEETVLLLVRMGYLFSVWIPVTWIHFLFFFTGKEEPFKYFYASNYGVAGVLFCFSLTPLMITGTHPYGDFQYYPSVGPIHHIQMAQFSTLVPYGFYKLAQSMRKASGFQRIQQQALFLATLLGFIGGTQNYLAAYNLPSIMQTQVLMLAYPFLTGIALIRYGLFDPHEIADTFRRDKLAAIGIISAGINHEIRNPLYIVQGLGQAYEANLQEGVYKDPNMQLQEANAAMKKILHQADRALDIMKRFSLFAKQGVDDATRPQPTLVLDVVQNVLPLIGYELELDNIDFICEASKAACVLADPRHLEEIFFNLIVNACHAIKNNNKPAVIRVSTSEVKDGVRIIIADNGPGISQEQLPNLFVPFHTTKKGGTGLGLYIVKQLVQRNKGRITADSSPAGTTFTIELPGAEKAGGL
ncbi:MAG: hypothetical protein A2Y02_03410 [Omnitrophica bacterium GWA2_52_12]|nr:MAG: hypothetical protein A2Y02_03410 [Omnitrophica bacterium GWA2_52_12]